MQSLKHTRFLTKNYSNLQGLRSIPYGLCILLVSLWANTLHGRANNLTIPILEAAACLVLFLIIDRYYNRVFGKIKRTYSQVELLLMGLSGLLALTAFIVDVDFDLNLPFSTLGLVFAAVILGSGVWYWYHQAKTLLISNLLLGVLIAIFSFLPLFGVSNWWNALGVKSFLLAMTILFGVYGIIGGIVGHIYFIRSLPVISEPNHG